MWKRWLFAVVRLFTPKPKPPTRWKWSVGRIDGQWPAERVVWRRRRAD